VLRVVRVTTTGTGLVEVGPGQRPLCRPEEPGRPLTQVGNHTRAAARHLHDVADAPITFAQCAYQLAGTQVIEIELGFPGTLRAPDQLVTVTQVMQIAA
jgi:hypothetical protein